MPVRHGFVRLTLALLVALTAVSALLVPAATAPSRPLSFARPFSTFTSSLHAADAVAAIYTTRTARRACRSARSALNAATSTSSSAPTTPKSEKKYILITGGVISGIGKGITASSIGVLCKMMNLKVTAIKIDPYLNVDAGTMSPFEHGETFVLDDGGETDLDLGNYERFLDIRLKSDSNLTTGKIYQAVIEKERKGQYLGKTVQIIPHITNEIMERVVKVAHTPVEEMGGAASPSQSQSQSQSAASALEEAISADEPDVCVIELGGTIGDIESMPFVEALRQLQLRVKRENFMLVHVSMVPIIGESQEQKTKPTQHSVKELRSLGLTPDLIVCRAKVPIEPSNREKIALFCNLPPEHVLSVPDVPNIYHVPLAMLTQGVHSLINARLGLDLGLATATANSNGSAAHEAVSLPPLITTNPFYNSWRQMTLNVDAKDNTNVNVAIVGKYTTQLDSYLSVISALKHACSATNQRLNLVMVESASLEPPAPGAPVDAAAKETHDLAWQQVSSADAILIPGGFGGRGIEGKVLAATYARVNKVPFLGICLGMQAAVIEYTRAVLTRPQANSREFTPDCSEADAAVVFMPEGDREKMGGTMRLGSRRTLITPNSLAELVYGSSFADERHRHRYEVNPSLVDTLEAAGLKFSGRDETNQRMEIAELPTSAHPYYIGCQYHPEFKSRPLRPAPVFLGLVQAARARLQLKAFKQSNLQQ